MSNDIEHEYIQFIENLRRDTRNRLHEAAMKWNELANDRGSQVSKHLFTIAALILPLSFFPITNNSLVNSLDITSKIIIVTSWILFILSLIFGLVHITKEAKFFNMWAEQENRRGKIYSEGIFTSSAKKAFDRLEEMNVKSEKEAKMESEPKKLWLRFQEITIVLGIIAIAVILFRFLNLQNKNNPLRQNHYWHRNYLLNN